MKFLKSLVVLFTCLMILNINPLLAEDKQDDDKEGSFSIEGIEVIQNRLFVKRHRHELSLSGGILYDNASWVSEGKFNGAIEFDGSSDYIKVVSPDDVPSGNSHYTIEAWIKPDAMGTRGIVGWGNSGLTNQVNALRLTSDGISNHWCNNDLVVTTGSLVGDWHHVVAEFDGTTRKIYLDGVLVGSDKPSGHNAAIANFRVGSTNSGEWFDGLIDEVAIYDKALTQEEIIEHYRRGVGEVEVEVRTSVDNTTWTDWETSTLGHLLFSPS